MLLFYTIAFASRLFLLTKFDLTSRVEASTPVNSHRRLAEGVFLRRRGVDPYAGAVFHEPPLVLAAAEVLLLQDFAPDRLNIIWILLDLATSFFVGCIARKVGERLLRQDNTNEANDNKEDPVQANKLLAKCHYVEIMSKHAQIAYLFNPYSLLSCAAKTTTVLDNVFLALFILFMLRKQRLPACLFLALAAYKSLYPVILLGPLCAVLMEDAESWRQVATRVILPTFATFLSILAALLWTSFELMGGSASFLRSTYGFVLSIPELTPNMGLLWYFFTEVYEHYRAFFVCIFQLNVFVYVLPLCIGLRRDPVLLTIVLLALIAIFKAYPGYGDVGLYLSLLPALRHLFPYIAYMLESLCALLVATAMGPVLHHLWIYTASANANYFFAANLAFEMAQIALVTNLLYAYVMREYYVKNCDELRADKKRTNGIALFFK